MMILLFFLLLWQVSPSYAGAYTYHSVYDYGLSNDQLSWIVIGSLLAFGIFLIVVIFVCRQCGCCGHPRDVGPSSPALSDTRPFLFNVSVIDSQGIDAFQQVNRPPEQSVSAKLPGLPPYAYERVPGDSPQTAPPPYTVKAEPW